MPTTIRLLTIITTSAIAAIILASFACSQPPPVEIERDVPVTVIVDREVPVTVEVDRTVEITYEVPVTVEVDRTVEVTREVPVTVEVDRTVEVTREVPVTVQVEKEIVRETIREIPVTVEVEKAVEVVREVLVTIEVPATFEVEVTRVVLATVIVETEVEVEVVRDDTFNYSIAALDDTFDVFNTDGDDTLTWQEACAGLETDLDKHANIWLIRIRDSWWFSDDEASQDAHFETFYWTNDELCERWK